MEKTYSALIERLRKHKDFCEKLAHDMEIQQDLNEYEKQIIVEEKAVASFIDTVLRVESQISGF